MTVTDLSAAERAVAILREQGIPATYEWFDGSIHIADDGCWWHFGTVAETWAADLMRDPAEGDYIGAASTDVPADSDDPEAIAAAIVAALNTGAGVEFYR